MFSEFFDRKTLNPSSDIGRSLKCFSFSVSIYILKISLPAINQNMSLYLFITRVIYDM